MQIIKYFIVVTVLTTGLSMTRLALGNPLAETLCASCHGPDGNSVVPAFPKLAGQQMDYLWGQMLDYKEGNRVNDIMNPLMANLSEADIKDLAEYYSGKTRVPAGVTQPDLLPLGEQIFLHGNLDNGIPSCASCHEEDGAGFGEFPRVAGQHVEYSMTQFRLYADGERRNGKRIMRTIAQRLSPEETRAVVEYIASLP
jgi:cytochrome c553